MEIFMKYALIGCGRISPNHIAAALKNELEIVGICDVALENCEALLEKFELVGKIRCYTDYNEMIVKEKPELVAIATESGYHAKIALECLEKNCNLIIEKPIALSLADADAVIALAERLEEVYRVGDPYPMFIDRNSPALKVLQQIRDEAHRFGITFHRKLRSKAQVESALKSIKGVGEKTEQRLLLHFGSVARIASAPENEVAALVGEKLAAEILKVLRGESSEGTDN